MKGKKRYRFRGLRSVKELRDPKCSSEVLGRIVRDYLEDPSMDDIFSHLAAYNPNCPPEVLVEVLRRGKNDWTSRGAVENSKCPPEILAEVLLREDYDYDIFWLEALSNISCRAAMNPNCPPEALVEALKKGKDDIRSCEAALNPNCPLKEKILWMKATGKIKDYDPNNPNHKLEEVEEYVDKDLEELKRLGNEKW